MTSLKTFRNNPSNTCRTDPPRIPSNDIGIRFNKISFAFSIPTEVSRPLMPDGFPLCPSEYSWSGMLFFFTILIREPHLCTSCSIMTVTTHNSVGLDLGQETLVRTLPTLLEEKWHPCETTGRITWTVIAFLLSIRLQIAPRSTLLPKVRRRTAFDSE